MPVMLEAVLLGLLEMKKELIPVTNVGEVFAFLQKKAPFEADQAYSPQPTAPLETVVAWRLL